jgi:hypothetical protein
MRAIGIIQKRLIDWRKEEDSNEWKRGQVELSLGGVIEYSSDHTKVEVLPAYYIQTVRKSRCLMDQSHVTVIFTSTFHDTPPQRKTFRAFRWNSAHSLQQVTDILQS